VEALVDLSSLLTKSQPLGSVGFAAAACYLTVWITRLLLAKHFGDRALKLTGKKAEHPQKLVRELLRGSRTPGSPTRKNPPSQ
jgi:hypothetical protein